MQSSELGVLRSINSVLATLFGYRLTSSVNHTPAPTPRTKAAAIKALFRHSPPLPDGLPGGGPPGGWPYSVLAYGGYSGAPYTHLSDCNRVRKLSVPWAARFSDLGATDASSQDDAFKRLQLQVTLPRTPERMQYLVLFIVRV